MQKFFVVLRLKFVTHFINFIIKVCRFAEHCCQVTNQEGAFDRFIVIIGNINVEDMHWYRAFVFPVIQEINDLIIHSLFACDDDVESLLTHLESFWCRFDSPVTIEHVK